MRVSILYALILLIFPLSASADNSSSLSPPWPIQTQVRLDLNFNRSWLFYREPAKAPESIPVYAPPASARIGNGDFPQTIDQQCVMFGAPHTARYVGLQATSSQNAGPFASIAELYLVDKSGSPLPRAGWKVAYADSEEAGSGDVAINVLDGNPQTKWHSRWIAGQPGMPHILILDLGKPTAFYGFRYIPRQDGNPSGMIKGWSFFASNIAPPQLKKTTPQQKDVSLLNDSTWDKVNLPHSVRLEPVNASGGRNFLGVCWYRKHFALKQAWQSKVLYLKFEGAMQEADVWLNGKHLTTHYGGYLPFTVDISKAANFQGDNVLTVRLDNTVDPEDPPGKPQDSLDFAYFGGLYRNVTLEVLNPLHVTDPILADKVASGGVFVTYPTVSPTDASVQIGTDVVNGSGEAKTCLLTQTLLAPDSSVVGSNSVSQSIVSGGASRFAQQIDVPNPKLWHPYHPYLYMLHTEVAESGKVVDDVYTRIGIRRIRFDNVTGLYINGERFVSIGANRHQDHPYVGYALPDSAQFRDAKKLRDAGFTSYRSHYPQSPAFMDACDQLGILAIVSNPGWQYMGDDLFKQRVYENARTMVRRDRNHASVVLWEAQLNETDNSGVAPTLYKSIHAEYPGDQCYAAGDRVAPTADFPGWDIEYSRNSGTKPLWIREWGDQVDNWSDQQSSSRIARGWGENPMLVQAFSHLQRLDDIWSYNNGPEGLGKGRLTGADLWAGIDCYRGYHHQPFLGGPLDLFRIPKFDYYMFQSQRPPDLLIPGVDSGPMVFIANFATFVSPTVVTVFSNCDQVRLSSNGREISTQSPDPGHLVQHPPFTFSVGQVSQDHSMLFSTGVAQAGVQIGELKAEGLIDGKVVATQTIESPGVPTHIELTVDTDGRVLTADGSDWVRLYARLCDSRGTTYPFGDDMVTFTVDGPGAVIGDATIGANPVRAEAGIATALIQSTTQPGIITVHASAFGLKPAVVTIQSEPESQPHLP